MSDSPVGFDPKTIPAEIDRWNWGAFLLNWIWGIGNNTYIALLTFVPFFGFIWMFVLGAKGSAWAWRNGRWDSVEHFKRVQRKWAIWGAVIWIGMLVLFGGAMGGVFYRIQALRTLRNERRQPSGEPDRDEYSRQPDLHRLSIRQHLHQRRIR